MKNRKCPSVVAASVSLAVRGGILPPGLSFDFRGDSALAGPHPPGGTPGSTAGRMPAATFFRHALRQVCGLGIAGCGLTFDAIMKTFGTEP